MADLTDLERELIAEWDSPNNNSSSEDTTNSDNSNNNPEKKKRKIDHLNVDTSGNEDGITNTLEASLDLPTTPTTTPNLPSVEEHEPKEEYVKKEDYDKLIKTHTEIILKLKHEFELITDKYKKEMYVIIEIYLHIN